MGTKKSVGNKRSCCRCNTKSKVKAYTIADNMEEPRYYCDKCSKKVQEEILIKLFSSILFEDSQLPLAKVRGLLDKNDKKHD